MNFSISLRYMSPSLAVMSDSTNPGATALTVMLRLASSLAIALVKPMMPALLAL